VGDAVDLPRRRWRAPDTRYESQTGSGGALQEFAAAKFGVLLLIH
jgi:hypothetical protein